MSDSNSIVFNIETNLRSIDRLKSDIAKRIGNIDVSISTKGVEKLTSQITKALDIKYINSRGLSAAARKKLASDVRKSIELGSRTARMNVSVSQASLNRLRQTIRQVTLQPLNLSVGAREFLAAKRIMRDLQPTTSLVFKQSDANKFKRSAELYFKQNPIRVVVSMRDRVTRAPAAQIKEELGISRRAMGPTTEAATLTQSTQAYRQKAAAVNTLSDAHRRGSMELTTFSERLGFSTTRLMAYAVPAALIFRLSTSLGVARRSIAEINKDITRLTQIMEGNVSRASLVGRKALQVASDLGTSGRELLNITTLLAQSGEKFNSDDSLLAAIESLGKSQLSATFGSLNQTTEGLLAFLNQFNVDGSESIRVLDVANQLSKKFAVSAEDLFTAVKSGGAAFSALGSDMEEFMAVVTAIRQLTRLPATTIGTSLNTISLRLFRSQNVRVIEDMGGSIKDANGQTKSFVGLMQEASTIFRGLDSLTAKTRFSEQLFGVRQGKIGLKLLEDMASSGSVTAKVLAAAGEAAGSVNRDAALGLKRIDIQMKSVGATFTKIFGELAQDRGLISFVQDVASGLKIIANTLSTISPLIPGMLKIGTVMLGGALIKHRREFVRGLSSYSPGTAGHSIHRRPTAESIATDRNTQAVERLTATLSQRQAGALGGQVFGGGTSALRHTSIAGQIRLSQQRIANANTIMAGRDVTARNLQEAMRKRQQLDAKMDEIKDRTFLTRATYQGQILSGGARGLNSRILSRFMTKADRDKAQSLFQVARMTHTPIDGKRATYARALKSTATPSQLRSAAARQTDMQYANLMVMTNTQLSQMLAQRKALTAEIAKQKALIRKEGVASQTLTREKQKLAVLQAQETKLRSAARRAAIYAATGGNLNGQTGVRADLSRFSRARQQFGLGSALWLSTLGRRRMGRRMGRFALGATATVAPFVAASSLDSLAQGIPVRELRAGSDLESSIRYNRSSGLARGALSGAASGAMLGSFVSPVVGTAMGLVVGGISGAMLELRKVTDETTKSLLSLASTINGEGGVRGFNNLRQVLDTIQHRIAPDEPLGLVNRFFSEAISLIPNSLGLTLGYDGGDTQKIGRWTRDIGYWLEGRQSESSFRKTSEFQAAQQNMRKLMFNMFRESLRGSLQPDSALKLNTGRVMQSLLVDDPSRVVVDIILAQKRYMRSVEDTQKTLVASIGIFEQLNRTLDSSLIYQSSFNEMQRASLDALKGTSSGATLNTTLLQERLRKRVLSGTFSGVDSAMTMGAFGSSTNVVMRDLMTFSKMAPGIRDLSKELAQLGNANKDVEEIQEDTQTAIENFLMRQPNGAIKEQLATILAKQNTGGFGGKSAKDIEDTIQNELGVMTGAMETFGKHIEYLNSKLERMNVLTSIINTRYNSMSNILSAVASARSAVMSNMGAFGVTPSQMMGVNARGLSSLNIASLGAASDNLSRRRVINQNLLRQRQRFPDDMGVVNAYNANLIQMTKAQGEYGYIVQQLNVRSSLLADNFRILNERLDRQISSYSGLSGAGIGDRFAIQRSIGMASGSGLLSGLGGAKNIRQLLMQQSATQISSLADKVGSLPQPLFDAMVEGISKLGGINVGKTDVAGEDLAEMFRVLRGVSTSGTLSYGMLNQRDAVIALQTNIQNMAKLDEEMQNIQRQQLDSMKNQEQTTQKILTAILRNAPAVLPTTTTLTSPSTGATSPMPTNATSTEPETAALVGSIKELITRLPEIIKPSDSGKSSQTDANVNVSGDINVHSGGRQTTVETLGALRVVLQVMHGQLASGNNPSLRPVINALEMGMRSVDAELKPRDL